MTLEQKAYGEFCIDASGIQAFVKERFPGFRATPATGGKIDRQPGITTVATVLTTAALATFAHHTESPLKQVNFRGFKTEKNALLTASDEVIRLIYWGGNIHELSVMTDLKNGWGVRRRISGGWGRIFHQGPVSFFIPITKEDANPIAWLNKTARCAIAEEDGEIGGGYNSQYGPILFIAPLQLG